MQLEAIKIDGQFVIPQLSNMELNTDKIIVDISDDLIKNFEENKKNVLSDEYIQKNWKDLVSKGLSTCDENYYKSEQYKLDRGDYLIEKYKWKTLF